MEKYGTIPPRFTKAWWAHYWYYYKIHFIAIVCILAAVISFIHHIVTEIHYDLQVQFVSSTPVSEESINLLEEKISEFSEDVTKNNKVETIVYQQTMLGDTPENMQYNQAIATKLMADLAIGDYYIYIGDKAFIDSYASSGGFMNVTEWADNVLPEKIYNSIAYSLSGNEQFSQMGFDTENMYIMVLQLYEAKKDKPEKISAHENAINTAISLIKE